LALKREVAQISKSNKNSMWVGAAIRKRYFTVLAELCQLMDFLMVLLSFFSFLRSHECLLTSLFDVIFFFSVAEAKRDKLKRNRFTMIYATPFKAIIKDTLRNILNYLINEHETLSHPAMKSLRFDKEFERLSRHQHR
jgi:hypothetical protein